MNWTALLKKEIDETYNASERLIDKVDANQLDWKPATGENWMTTGQLLQHMTTACGLCIRGFVTGDWGMPEGVDFNDLPPEDMLPTADKMPAAESIDAVKKALAEDRQVALAMLSEAGEDRLANEPTTAPWDPSEMSLGHRCLHMIGHLATHKSQLFYYLKLQGQPVNTHDMYGMS